MPFDWLKNFIRKPQITFYLGQFTACALWPLEGEETGKYYRAEVWTTAPQWLQSLSLGAHLRVSLFYGHKLCRHPCPKVINRDRVIIIWDTSILLLNIASFTVDFRFLFKSSIMGLYNRKQFDPALKVFTVMEEVSSLGCACTYLLYLSSKPFAINSVFWSSKQIGRAPVEVELSCWISVREAGDVHVRRQRKLHCGYKGKKSCISFFSHLQDKKGLLWWMHRCNWCEICMGQCFAESKETMPQVRSIFQCKNMFFPGLVCQVYKS